MMGSNFVDAHCHLGSPGVFFAPQTQLDQLLSLMDRLSIQLAVCTDHLSLSEGAGAGIAGLRRSFEESNGRIHYLGVYDPRCSEECLAALNEAAHWPGFVGVKIHPAFHRTAAEDVRYEPVWRFAADHDVTVLAHSWSVSDYNPAQQYATPGRFESYLQRFPSVRLVLAHAGGRGTGRHELIRLVNTYPNAFTDFAGDIFCYRLIESLIQSIPDDRILFGSDFPWVDPRANCSRVLLANIPDEQKAKILRGNAIRVYKLESALC